MLSFNKSVYYLILVMVIYTFSTNLSAQSNADSIIISAMKDELNRSMTELKKQDYEKPFYISYTIANISTLKASAKLGALTSSDQNQFKDWNVRVMVGDYEINDENFMSEVNDNNYNRFVYNMPIENDYMGIRRALWSQTDLVYNSAAKLYKQKKFLINNEKVNKELLKIPDFSKTDIIQINIEEQSDRPTLSSIESRVRNISEFFSRQNKIHDSRVTFHQLNANVYFLNSENIQVQYPLCLSTLTVSFSTIDTSNVLESRRLEYVDLSYTNLPDDSVIYRDIEYMISDIEEVKNAESFEDDYSGPVLFQGKIVANLFESALFKSGKKLIAFRKPLKRTDSYTSDDNLYSTGKDWNINDVVIDKNLTVIDLSSKQGISHENIWGHYKVDAEGVVPVDSLVLIKNGVLINKYNGRTPSSDVKSSNGHNRHSISAQGIFKTNAPGVLKVIPDKSYTFNDLKERLILEAMEENYDYAILIESADVNSINKPNQYYKIDLKTGIKTRIKDVMYRSVADRQFKKIGGTTNEMIVVNKTFSYNSGYMPHLPAAMDNSNSGVPITIISPSALLINRVDLRTHKFKRPEKKPIIESPLNSTSNIE